MVKPSWKRLDKAFFERHTLEVAADLIGKLLIHRDADGTYHVGRVVETEAYRGEDPACHAHHIWRTNRAPFGRAGILYDEPGTAYIYLNYGVHWLFNVVTESKGEAGAVLIRALEPVQGIASMQARRPQCRKIDKLCAGPGNLTKAMGIGPEYNGIQTTQHATLFFAEETAEKPAHLIKTTSRIGINKGQELPWRFISAKSPALSGSMASI